MRNRRMLWIVGLVLLVVIGVVLYADLQSVHQIFKISDGMIRNAPDAQTRENLIADRDKRDREERRHKMAIEGALVVDAILFGWATLAALRRSKDIPHVTSNTVA